MSNESIEAIKALAPIIGSGGIVGLLIAWLGYKTQAARGRADNADVAGVMVSAVSLGTVKASDVELVANALSQISASIDRSNLIQEFKLRIDGKHDEFEEWSLRAEVEALRAERHRRT